jgi:spoIIIJ-associated protein
MAKGAVDPALAAGEAFVSGLFERLEMRGVKVKGSIEAGTVVLKLTGKVEGLQRNRELIAAASLLASQIVSRTGGERLRCMLDVGGELDDRRQLLEGLAAEVADAVVRTGRRAVIEALTPGERRVVHTALMEDERVATRSEGDEDHRALLIEPAS